MLEHARLVKIYISTWSLHCFVLGKAWERAARTPGNVLACVRCELLAVCLVLLYEVIKQVGMPHLTTDCLCLPLWTEM